MGSLEPPPGSGSRPEMQAFSLLVSVSDTLNSIYSDFYICDWLLMNS